MKQKPIVTCCSQVFSRARTAVATSTWIPIGSSDCMSASSVIGQGKHMYFAFVLLDETEKCFMEFWWWKNKTKGAFDWTYSSLHHVRIDQNVHCLPPFPKFCILIVSNLSVLLLLEKQPWNKESYLIIPFYSNHFAH